MIKYRNLASELKTRINDRVGSYRGPVGRVFHIFNNTTRAAQAALVIGPHTGDEDGRAYAPSIYVQSSLTGVQGAIDNCTNGYGDVLLFEPGSHNSYAAITLNKTYVSLLGPAGASGPFSRQTNLRGFLSSADRTTDNVFGPVLNVTQGYYHLEGINFFAATNDSGAVNLDSTGTTHGGGMGVIRNCGFPPDTGIDVEYNGIQIKAAHFIEIDNCYFGGQSTGAISTIGGVSESVFIRNCIFHGCVYGLNLKYALNGGLLENCTFHTSASPGSQAMTYGITSAAGVTGDVTIVHCSGTMSAGDFVTQTGTVTVLGETAGYTVLT
jgi:hypothetical protein